MFDLDRWEEIWSTIVRNKWRSFMTAMGVFWGVFMLIIMSGSGVGLQRMFMSNISFATNSCAFFGNKTSEAYDGLPRGRVWTMKSEDIEIIRNEISGIEYISRLLPSRIVKTIRLKESTETDLVGFEPNHRYIELFHYHYGRFINDMDMLSVRKVCCIGFQLYKQLFPEGNDPIGSTIQVGNNIYTIIGVHESLNPNMSMNGIEHATSVIIPLTTMQQIYAIGTDVDAVMMTSEQGYDITKIEKEVDAKFREIHRISPTDDMAVMSFNLKEQIGIFENLFLGLNILIWIVGIGTLFAGVIGVSNIMLIVVKERTQEIGVRRALGAKPSAIIIQIMSESFILTFIAGVMALGISVGILSIAEAVIAANAANSGSAMEPFSPQITFGFAIVSASVILASGLLSGIIPALRAMSIKAVDAIREE